jgi:hypothetical protein
MDVVESREGAADVGQILSGGRTAGIAAWWEGLGESLANVVSAMSSSRSPCRTRTLRQQVERPSRIGTTSISTPRSASPASTK